MEQVRRRAADEDAGEWADHSPPDRAIGCPVIASIAGADVVLVVTEPTLSGLHDLQRVADLTKHFGIDTLVCINKCDLNEDIASQIDAQARGRGLKLAGRVRYDRAVTEAQIHKQAVVEYRQDGCTEDIRRVWDVVQRELRAAERSAAEQAS